MKKENRDIKIQVRITASEKGMLQELSERDREFSISRLVRESIIEEYGKQKEGIGVLTIRKEN